MKMKKITVTPILIKEICSDYWNGKDWENSNAGMYFSGKYFEKEVQADKKLIYETY